ncbi:Fe-S protein assembly co-chaperone HscB [Ideonella sp. DXS29W]|uniref:Co-chaperone protein HscB homolog n=1 Tax=Ideonella lacteola TaxID=2984193 RepID=A0ABU9BTD1_9BURK
MKLDDDDFTLFGLAPRFAQERSDIDRRWKELQAQVHPDRFSAEGAAAQRLAMQWAVRVNQAHQRLKDPVARAAYLCELRGAPVDAERNTAMPPSFLMQQMQWREALDEAGDPSAIQALDDEVAERETQLLGDVGRALDQDGDAHVAAEKVRALMFVQRFRADVDRRLEQFDT